MGAMKEAADSDPHAKELLTLFVLSATPAWARYFTAASILVGEAAPMSAPGDMVHG